MGAPDRDPGLAVERPVGAARLVADEGAIAGWEPEADVRFGEDEERPESPVGVCLAGVGSGGALTDGVVGVRMVGVEMDGVEMVGVEMVGVAIGGTTTGPTPTDGVVAEGTVTAGTLTVGTVTAGTLTVGTDAAEDATVTSSAAQAPSAATACQRRAGRRSHRSPPDRSATNGLDIATRLRTGPLLIGPRARAMRLPHTRWRSARSQRQFKLH